MLEAHLLFEAVAMPMLGDYGARFRSARAAPLSFAERAQPH